jgi:hypothetical protein
MIDRIVAILLSCLILIPAAAASAEDEPAAEVSADEERNLPDESWYVVQGRAAEVCEGTCADGDGSHGQLETVDGQCSCSVEAEFESVEETARNDRQAAQSRCTQGGCNTACAPNQCVGYRETSTGCRYSCLLNTTTDVERTPVVR